LSQRCLAVVEVDLVNDHVGTGETHTGRDENTAADLPGTVRCWWIGARHECENDRAHLQRVDLPEARTADLCSPCNPLLHRGRILRAFRRIGQARSRARPEREMEMCGRSHLF